MLRVLNDVVRMCYYTREQTVLRRIIIHNLVFK